MNGTVNGTMELRTADCSRVGGRRVNEDCSGHEAGGGGGWWVVADGLGGHGGGDVASRHAVDAILAAARNGAGFGPEALESSIAEAHRRIRAAQAEEGPAEMHTTVAVLACEGSRAVWAHVGDTRLYHFRGGRVAHQTADHSVPQMLVETGEIAPAEVRRHRDRSRLLRALGQEAPPRPTLGGSADPLRRGDAFLLCSDGWWEHVEETEMEIDLAKADGPAAWLDLMADRIAAVAGDDHDNYTAVAVFVA